MKKLSVLLINFIILIFLLESGTRFLGYDAYHPFDIYLDNIRPHSPLKSDTELGYALNPGTYKYEYHSGYYFIATHDSNGYRISSQEERRGLTSINFYGCSFFYGYGLSDTSVFTYKLSNKLKNYKINNCAVFGSNLVYSYLLLKKQIKENKKPDIAVISYASFYLDRNVYAVSYKKCLIHSEKILSENKLGYLYARLTNNKSSVTISNEPFSYNPLPLIKYSAFLNTANDIYIKNELESYNPYLVDSILLEKFIELGNANNIKIVFAIINKDQQSNIVYNRLIKQKVKCVDISLDYSLNKYNLMPNENHPNELAHEFYAEKTADYLLDKGMVRNN